MKPELRRVGHHASPVVIIDDFLGNIDAVATLADELAPFPPAVGSYFPGLRRMISPADTRADAYARQVCECAAPFIAGAFEIDEFDLLEASFSIVTTPPRELIPAQRAPHFDSPDPRRFALLHYLRCPADSGTAFYRQRATGIEVVTEHNVGAFVHAAEHAAAALSEGAGYIGGSDAHYEQTGMVQALPDRLLIYQGSLLHSGIIPTGMTFSSNPRHGRLTANLFVRGH